MYPDLLWQIALSMTPNVGDIRAKKLFDHFGSAAAVFRASPKLLEKVEGIGSLAASSVRNFSDHKLAEEEVEFIDKCNIIPLHFSDDAYPQRLLNCCDCPSLLYYKGNADLNSARIVSVVGTRNNTEQGRKICEQFIEALAELDVLVFSGLAFGIDTIAHRACVKQHIKTVGVLAHGLDKIYPAQNKQLAKDMTSHGGLLTDFPSGTNPDRQNFPGRNRIVAGACDALVVIESSEKGGSLITAELANSYNKDVFAFPGRVTDARSSGCNNLIKQNKSHLITSASDLLEMMGWSGTPKKAAAQRELFIELSEEERLILSAFDGAMNADIDLINQRSGMHYSKVANALLMLEMKGVLASLPGKTYKLV